MTVTIKQALDVAAGELSQSDCRGSMRNSCLLTSFQLSAAIYTRIPNKPLVVSFVSGLTYWSGDALNQNPLPTCWVRKVSGI